VQLAGVIGCRCMGCLMCEHVTALLRRATLANREAAAEYNNSRLQVCVAGSVRACGDVCVCVQMPIETFALTRPAAGGECVDLSATQGVHTV
jgi:hypothetical protein